MKKYDFFIGEVAVSLVPFFDREEEIKNSLRDLEYALPSGGVAMLLCPGYIADFDVFSVCDDNLKTRESEIVFAALSYFFKSVRGYPDLTLDIRYNGKRREITVENASHDILLNLEKCKFKCTKNAKFPDGVELECSIYDFGKTVASVLCHDSELFGSERLKKICSPVCADTFDAVAVSFNAELTIRTGGCIEPHDAAAVGVLSLLRAGVVIPEGRMVTLIDGKEHIFLLHTGAHSDQSDGKYLS